MDIAHAGLAQFVSCQNEYSLLKRDADIELLPMMQAYGMGLLPYYPLASGVLTGKYRRNMPMPAGARLTVHAARYGDRFLNDANWPIVERLEEFATQRGRTLLELAFSWLAARPCVSSIIAGATKPEQLEANVRAVNWALTAEEIGGGRSDHAAPVTSLASPDSWRARIASSQCRPSNRPRLDGVDIHAIQAAHIDADAVRQPNAACRTNGCRSAGRTCASPRRCRTYRC